MSSKPLEMAACFFRRSLSVFFCLASCLCAFAADPALPAGPGVAAPLSGTAGAPLATPPSVTSSALAGASSLSLSWSGYFEALAILCFALALLWVLLWLVKRHGKGGFLGAAGGMRIENRLALGPKKWILVVRCFDRRLVLGLTDENISLLTELPLEESSTTGKFAPGAANIPAGKSASGAASGAAAGTADPDKADDSDQLFASLLRAGKQSAKPEK